MFVLIVNSLTLQKPKMVTVIGLFWPTSLSKPCIKQCLYRIRRKSVKNYRIGAHFTAPVMDPPMVDILISRFSYGNPITRKLRSSCIYLITLNFTLSFHCYTIACWVHG